MRTALQLAALDVAGGLEQLRALELLEQRVVFFEFAPPKKRGTRGHPPTEIARPGANTAADFAPATSETSDRRGTGRG